MSTPEPGFRPDDHPNWVDRLRDRMSPTQRNVAYSVAWVVGLTLWGLFVGTVLRLPGDTWGDAFAFPVLMSLAVVGLRWAPSRSTPPSMTLRARRTRAWIGVPAIIGLPPLFIGSTEVFGGMYTAFFALVIGVLADRWVLYDIRFTDLFGDSQRQPDAAAQVAKHSEWDRQHPRVTGDDRERR